MANHNNSDYLSNLREFRARLESRVAPQNGAMPRQYLSNHINPQRELISTPILPDFNRPMLTQDTRNFINTRAFQSSSSPSSQSVIASRGSANLFPYTSLGAPSQQAETSRFSSEAMMFGRNIAFEFAQFQAPQIQKNMEMKVSPVDGTKPYINLLEIPVTNDEFINRANMYVGNPEMTLLDLELRL
ncbi:hypothetical protein Lal_00018246 [Lupinus albus]|uniref:Uncharacterized protein n=1 Tax=Lupinus albus TaxID=3870 RepID=A0A6A4MW56_LUPAL|nr:hypothetical protein Lalb_Chr25g0286921 [Lupinus albus]KAF1866860.1 hypothetical protein Lal_00018246 [Lupinus albus]